MLVNICSPGHSSLSSSGSSSPLWAIKLNSAKEHFISFCLKPASTVLNSPSEHSGIQIGTLSSDGLEAALWSLPGGVAGGASSAPIQRLRVRQRDSMVLGYGTPNKLMADIWHCPPPSVSVAPLSTCANTYARPPTLTPSVPFGSPSCLLLWPDEPPLFICYYTGIVRSKNQEGACVCASAVGCRAAAAPSFHPCSRCLSISLASDWMVLRRPSVRVDAALAGALN